MYLSFANQKRHGAERGARRIFVFVRVVRAIEFRTFHLFTPIPGNGDFKAEGDVLPAFLPPAAQALIVPWPHECQQSVNVWLPVNSFCKVTIINIMVYLLQAAPRLFFGVCCLLFGWIFLPFSMFRPWVLC